MQWIRWFNEITIADVPRVGGKNASLGEMIRELTPKGIAIPNGFAVTAELFDEVQHVSGHTCPPKPWRRRIRRSLPARSWPT